MGWFKGPISINEAELMSTRRGRHRCAIDFIDQQLTVKHVQHLQTHIKQHEDRFIINTRTDADHNHSFSAPLWSSAIL